MIDYFADLTLLRNDDDQSQLFTPLSSAAKLIGQVSISRKLPVRWMGVSRSGHQESIVLRRKLGNFLVVSRVEVSIAPTSEMPADQQIPRIEAMKSRVKKRRAENHG